MKRLLLVPFLFLCLTVQATTYYVATTGNDAAAGTIAAPWLTWQKAFWTAQAGDTVFFRGGVYPQYPTNGYGINYTPSDGGKGYDGTAADPIVYINYPGEVPILDGSNVTSITDPAINWGLSLRGVDHVRVIGLTLRNFNQISSSTIVEALRVTNASTDYPNNIIIKDCKVYNIEGIAFETQDPDTVSFINCDAYNNCDSISSFRPGNYGSGFSVHSPTTSHTSGVVSFSGCRAWNCSDNGFVFGTVVYVAADSCWSWNNGYLDGGGHGYKIGYVSSATLDPQRYITNCVAYNNRESGFTMNDNLHPAQSVRIYNNIAYHNGYDPSVEDYGNPNIGVGFVIYNTTESDAKELNRIFKNNIAYDNEEAEIYVATNALYTHSYNSWDIPVTITDADFVSVDSIGIRGARQSNGTLPIINFLKLSDVSQAIDRGVDVGITYEGAAPDLGPFEFDNYGTPPVDPNIATKYPDIHSTLVFTGGFLIYDGGGTISAKGVCYSTSVNPTISDSKVTGGTGTADFNATLRGLSKNTTYHLRAYATNETGTSYGADIEFTTTDVTVIFKTNPIFSNGKIVIL